MSAISVEAASAALLRMLDSAPPARRQRELFHEEDALFDTRFLLSHEFAITHAWDGEPILFCFHSPEHHIAISENVRTLLSCFSGKAVTTVRQAVQTFLSRATNSPDSKVTSSVLASVRELAELGVLLPSHGRPPIYSTDMVAHYQHARQIPDEIPSVVARAAKVSATTSILEIGSGVGSIANRLAETSHDVTGLDISEPFLDAARETALQRGLPTRFHKACGNKLVLDEEEYDVIVVSQAFHWLDTSLAVRGLYRSLRNHGLLYILESKPVLPLSNPLKSLLGHGCPDRQFVARECGRHAEWYANLFEALKPPDTLISLKRTWTFHQQRRFGPDYARAFFFTNDMKQFTPGQEDPWIQIDKAFEHHPSEGLLGDMYWVLIELEKDACQKSPFEDPRNRISVSLDSTIELGMPEPQG